MIKHVLYVVWSKYSNMYFYVLFCSIHVISRILLLPWCVFPIFFDCKNFGNNRMAGSSRYGIKNVRNLTFKNRASYI